MQSVELVLTAGERVATGVLERLLRAGAQEPAEVDRTLGARPLTGEVAREELVERLGAVVPGAGGDIFGQFRLL